MKNNYKKKILCCVLLVVVLLSFGLNVAAAPVQSPYLNDGESFARWFGMGLSSIQISMFEGGVGTTTNQNPATFYDGKSPYYSLSYALSPGVFDVNTSEIFYTEDQITGFPVDTTEVGLRGYTDYVTDYFYKDRSEDGYENLGTFSYLVTQLPTVCNPYYYTTAEFLFEPFYVNQATMDFRDFLYITPTVGITSPGGNMAQNYEQLNMYVTFEYDAVIRQWDSNKDNGDGTVGGYNYYKGHETENDWWTWDDVINRGLNTNSVGYKSDGCFMPPSVTGMMRSSLETGVPINNPVEYIISNLSVKVYNFIGNYSSIYANEDGKYAFGKTSYMIGGFGYDSDKQSHHDATIINYNQGGFQILPKLDDWGVLGAPDTDPLEMSWLAGSVGAFMGFEIFPNFSIGGLLAIVVGLCLLIAFLKVFAGG